MPEPNVPAVNPILSNIAIQYRNPDFIADLVLPPIPGGVTNRTGRYQVYTKSDRFNLWETRLAPKAEAREIDWSVTEASYSCTGHALREFVSDEEENNAASPVTPQADTVELLQDLMLVAREKRVNDLLVTTPGAAAAAKWDLPGTNVIKDVLDAHKQVFAPPNTVIMSYDVFLAIKHNTGILDRVKYTQLGVVTTDLLASLFEVDRVLVGKSKYNIARRGQTPNFAQVWTDNVYVCFINPRPSTRSLTLGLTFWERIFGPGLWRVRTWREEKRGLGGGTMIQVETSLDERLVAPDVAFAIRDVL